MARVACQNAGQMQFACVLSLGYRVSGPYGEPVVTSSGCGACGLGQAAGSVCSLLAQAGTWLLCI